MRRSLGLHVLRVALLRRDTAAEVASLGFSPRGREDPYLISSTRSSSFLAIGGRCHSLQ